ncbi:MAG: ATP-dependent 6-phosphofructokinase [Capsulimonas sp.]|uniref:6-phosphofructokinase n=1 Tax=Capsulimonas sp. TaxID=2494211 RepID=UPI0032676E0F
MKIGMLTGGGDCPGLNPAIRGAVLRLLEYGDEVIGFQQGWKGLVEGNTEPLTLERVEGIIDQGGTILRSSRTNPFAPGKEAQLEAVLANIKKFELDALVALGGEDTLGVASKLYTLHNVPTVGVPKTMDNDLDKTDYTFGFDSAASVALESIDRLRDTAKSHDRVIVVEVMGRHAGWMALWSGVAGAADWVLLPEVAVDIEAMCEQLKKNYARGKTWGIVVVSEGVEIPGAQKGEDVQLDAFGHHQLGDVGIGPAIAKEIEKRTGFPTRDAVLGHTVRGGSPTLFDRILGTRVGIHAAELVHKGDFGKMVALQGTEIVAVPIQDAVKQWKLVSQDLYDTFLPTFNK